MTNGRPKKRGRPRKVKPVAVGDFAPKRVRPDSPDLFERMMEFVRWLVIRVVIATVIGLVAFFAIIASVEEPEIISPLGSEPGMPRGYRLIPISHPEVAHAEEIKKEVNEQPQTPKTDIERLVLETFGANQYDTVMCIIKHESGARTDAIGDQHLMVYDPVYNEYVGDSIGVMQIRTGGQDKKTGKIWNRARANGMTADEFRAYLKDPVNNVFMGDKISGNGKNWGPWSTYKKCK